MHYVLYALKWALLLSIPIVIIWLAFNLVLYLPEYLWWLRGPLIWGGIWLPLVILASVVDYSRSQGRE